MTGRNRREKDKHSIQQAISAAQFYSTTNKTNYYLKLVPYNTIAWKTKKSKIDLFNY